MKKSIFILALAVCAIPFYSCTKEDSATVQDNVQASVEGYPFHLSLTTSETKTVADGYNVSWSQGDTIRVFHAEAGTENYVDDGAFIYGVDGSQFFVGETAEFIIPGALYDWYVIYPYNEEYTSPKDGIFTATVTEQDPSLAGATPMYGNVKELDGLFDLVIPVHQLMSVIKFNITNNGFDTFVPTRVILNTEKSDYQIAGQYKLDITGDAPAFSGRNSEPAYSGGSQPKYKNIDFSNPQPLFDGESFTCYCTLPEMTIAANSMYKVYINAEGKVGYFLKQINFEEETALKAGRVTTMNISLDAQSEIAEDVDKVSFLFGQSFPWQSYFTGKTYRPVMLLSTLDKNSTNDFYQGSEAGSTDLDNVSPHAAITAYAAGSVAFQSNANRHFIPTQTMKDALSDFNLQVFGQYAKIPAGKKLAFYCSMFINNNETKETHTCDKWNWTVSFDGGTTFVPAAVEANAAYCDEIKSSEGYIDLKTSLDNQCYPVKVSSPAVATDLEHAKVVFKVSREPEGTYGGHFGLAPYYNFNGETRIYGKAMADNGDYPGEWIAYLTVE